MGPEKNTVPAACSRLRRASARRSSTASPRAMTWEEDVLHFCFMARPPVKVSAARSGTF